MMVHTWCVCIFGVCFQVYGTHVCLHAAIILVNRSAGLIKPAYLTYWEQVPKIINYSWSSHFHWKCSIDPILLDIEPAFSVYHSLSANSSSNLLLPYWKVENSCKLTVACWSEHQLYHASCYLVVLCIRWVNASFTRSSRRKLQILCDTPRWVGESGREHTA